MHWISHRGNIFVSNKKLENDPSQIEKLVKMSFECEIDVRVSKNKKIYLGHDSPMYEVDTNWLDRFSKNLWIHCKDWETLDYFCETKHNYFFHNTDDYTITSHGYIWAFPCKCFSSKFIDVLPERNIETQDRGALQNKKAGICSDMIGKYREK